MTTEKTANLIVLFGIRIRLLYSYLRDNQARENEYHIH